MIKVSSQDEKSIWVGCLLLTDVLVQIIQCLTPVVVGVGRDVYSNEKNGCIFPGCKLAWESQLTVVAFKLILIKLAWESQLTDVAFKLILIIILLRLNF